ncbi:hypothetical protein A3Q56_08208 [Intoshia linei]|uniref:Neurotransmitter-gated ion-channel ligand-binding domain-containing protein n=1 Tax=Intoshia linei TaxID=1819745 RepID=A0A177ARU3_9BILA|nr:hypothetical protein A3Q56_08208 [Intoshia linei]
MYNSADEDIDSKFSTNIVVYNDGKCSWVPPGIFISSCAIDITWFPFDDQICKMKVNRINNDQLEEKIEISYTGSKVNIINYRTYKYFNATPSIIKSKIILRSVNNTKIPSIGYRKLKLTKINSIEDFYLIKISDNIISCRLAIKLRFIKTQSQKNIKHIEFKRKEVQKFLK